MEGKKAKRLSEGEHTLPLKFAEKTYLKGLMTLRISLPVGSSSSLSGRMLLLFNKSFCRQIYSTFMR